MTPAEIQERVDRLFDRFERMSDAEFLMLRATWDDADPEGRELAWQSVKAMVKARGRERMLVDARSRMSSWINNNPFLAGIEATPTWPSNPSGLNQASVRQAALPPMLDAIAATIVADAIDAKDSTILLEPMLQVGS